MKYKVGDKVKIYTWMELTEKYRLDFMGDIALPSGRCWSKEHDIDIPVNRIVTIAGFYYTNDPVFKDENNIVHYVIDSMIKSHANEYYLQQIKEEL